MVKVVKWTTVRNHYGAHKRSLNPGNAGRTAVMIAVGNAATPLPLERRNRNNAVRIETEKGRAIELGWRRFRKGIKHARNHAKATVAEAEAEVAKVREAVYRLRMALATVSAGLDQMISGMYDAPTVEDLNEIAERALEHPGNQGGLPAIDGTTEGTESTEKEEGEG